MEIFNIIYYADFLVKNVVDVTLGGLTYWTFGYGLSFGEPSNWFCGFGHFFLTELDTRIMGTRYTHYVFQFSFATAATTIVSGAIAERMKLSAYMAFSIVNTFIYCFPASWAWNSRGFLAQLGFFDFAGACVVHLTGGSSAFIAAWLLGPRMGRFSVVDHYCMSSPVTALTGTFMLWWAWLGFNCGSSFGVQGSQWKTAAKAGINTLNGSIAGGITGLCGSMIYFRGKSYDITILITSILAGLVGVSAGCAVITPCEALILGCLSAIVAILAIPLLEALHVDDPVGAVPVHLFSAIVGTLGVGIFGQDDYGLLNGAVGLVHGGGFRLLAVQLFALVTMMIWSMLMTGFFFYFLHFTIGLRVTTEEELLGADWVEHNVRSTTFVDMLEQAFTELNVQDDNVEIVVKKLREQIESVDEHRPIRRGSTWRQLTGRDIKVDVKVNDQQKGTVVRDETTNKRINSVLHFLDKSDVSLRAIPCHSNIGAHPNVPPDYRW